MKSPLSLLPLFVLFGLFLSTFAAAELPKVTVCASSQLTAQPVEDGITYACAKTCTGSLASCTQCEPGGLCQFTVSVAGAGAHLYYNPLPGAPTLFFHTGGGGTDRYPPEAFKGLRQAGLKVVEIEWSEGISVTNVAGDGTALGWLTRPNGRPSSVAELSKRPAAIIQLIHDNLAEGKKFGTASCSGGSIATFDAVYFNGVGKLLDYQQLNGGPYYDIGWACGEGPDPFQFNGLATLALPITKLVDHVHKTGNACQRHKSDPAFAASSPRLTPGDWHFEYPVDFLSTANELGSDAFLGIRNQALSVVARSTGPDRTLTTNDGPHCVGNQLAGCQKICARMLGKQDCGCEEFVQ